jgi:SLT domain-containing protein
VLEAPFKAALDTITRIWNDTIGQLKMPNIPGSGVVGGALHAIGLQTGGIVTSPTLAVIGENGPEAVVPLSHGMPRSGPALVIQNATFNHQVDVDMLSKRLEFALGAGVAV